MQSLRPNSFRTVHFRNGTPFGFPMPISTQQRHRSVAEFPNL